MQALIDTALQHNADVLTVRQNIEQASWQMRSAGLCFLPSFAFAPSATWQKAQSQPATKTYELPLTMQWEMHFGGENKAKKSSAKYLYFSAQQQLAFTQRKRFQKSPFGLPVRHVLKNATFIFMSTVWVSKSYFFIPNAKKMTKCWSLGKI